MQAAEFVVTPEASGSRLDAYLSPRLPLLSRTKIRVLLASRAVHRNGRAATGGERLREGDRVRVQWDPAKLPPVPPEPFPLAVLWEDAHLAAIDKPAGMLMHPTMGVKRGTLAGALLAAWNPWLHEGLLVNPEARQVQWPHFAHRLDRETSGVVLVARDEDTARGLAESFARRQVGKEYLAILEGEMPDGEVTVTEPIARVSESAPHWRIDAAGALAASVIRVLARDGGRSLALLQPVTGRTNQLRIHAAYHGFPILGDVAYGAPAAERLFLHAWRLAFPHPEHRGLVQTEAPVPASFANAWPGPWPQLPAA